MRILALLAAGLLMGVALSAPVPKALKNKVTDAELLAGRWEIVSEDEGNDHKRKDSTMYAVFKDGNVSTGSAARTGFVNRPFKVEDGQSHKCLDVEYAPGKFVPYIYELDGDTLRWCHSQPDQPRPTEFKGGRGRYCFVYRRVQEEKKDK